MKKLLLFCLSAVVLLASCVKKKDVVTGEAHVRIVNAIPGSFSQDVYINSTSVKAGLAYPFATAYNSYTAGVNDIGITNTGTTISNLTFSYASEIGEYATVFFLRNLAGALSAGGIKDDMTAPPTGKARVRFMNVHSYLNDSFTMSIAGGSSLFTSLIFTTASPYYNVDPGTKFTATASTVTNPVTIDFNPQAGKIYTVWVSGSSNLDLNGYAILQNY
jgi:hypothetical protein